jgi:hypothetical protein
VLPALSILKIDYLSRPKKENPNKTIAEACISGLGSPCLKKKKNHADE